MEITDTTNLLNALKWIFNKFHFIFNLFYAKIFTIHHILLYTRIQYFENITKFYNHLNI